MTIFFCPAFRPGLGAKKRFTIAIDITSSAAKFFDSNEQVILILLNLQAEI